MANLIDKAAVLAEIERLRALLPDANDCDCLQLEFARGQQDAFTDFEVFIRTLEVKEVDTWHLQEKEDIYDAVKDWSLHTFVCIMKDGTIQKFTGNRDEDCEGHINVHIDGVNDDYDNVDDIVKWIEYT